MVAGYFISPFGDKKAVVTGLLKLQEMTDNNAASVLYERRSRIKFMAIAHQFIKTAEH